MSLGWLEPPDLTIIWPRLVRVIDHIEMPPDEIQFRDRHGRLVGKIIGLATEEPMPASFDPTSGTRSASADPWRHRSTAMRCQTCMYYVPKADSSRPTPPEGYLGRCRRHAPTMSGFPAVFPSDWCGDHKLDEAKVLVDEA